VSGLSPAEKIINKLEEKERGEWTTAGLIKGNIFKDSDTIARMLAEQLRPGREIIIIPPPLIAGGEGCAKTLLVLIGEYEGQDTGRLKRLLEEARRTAEECAKEGITEYIIFYAAAWNAIFYAGEYKDAFNAIKGIKEIWLKMPLTKAVRLK